MKSTAILVLITIIFVIFSLSASAQLGWFTEVIDPNVSDADDYDAAGTTITPGYLGIPWMSYVDGPYDGERFHLKTVHLSDSDEWIISTVDTNTWGHASIIMELDWTPHLAYRRGHLYDQGILQHAYRDNFYNWVVDTVDATAGLQDPMIKLNEQNSPVIVYGCGASPNPQNLKIAVWTGFDWEIEIVDSAGRCEQISFVFDSNGNPHIAYVLVSGGCFLKYAYWNGERWEDEVLAQITSGYSTSIALDSDDRPHIAYHYAAEGIWYTYNTTGDWQTEEVNSDYCQYARLSLNLDEEPCIAYYHADNGALMFSMKTNGQWITQVVEDDPSPTVRIGRFPDIMTDYWGDVCISYYYHETGQPCKLKYAAGYYQNAWVHMTPYNPPIIIPAGGGSFEFNIEIHNPTVQACTLDVWTNAVLSPGWDFGPFLLVRDFIAPPNWSGSVDRIQEVPARAEPGQYYYRAFIGDYDSTIVNMSIFEFEKLADDDGGTSFTEWKNWGGEFRTAEKEYTSAVPNEFAVLEIYPNPFNASTALSYQLLAVSYVNLTVYDVTGREVAKLVDGELAPGIHHSVWHAEGFASGIYFARLEAGEFRQVKKMLLVK